MPLVVVKFVHSQLLAAMATRPVKVDKGISSAGSVIGAGMGRHGNNLQGM